MRILMLVFNPVGKGTYWRALYLARGLARVGHEVTLLATSRTRRWGFDVRADEQVGVTLVESPDLLWGGLRSGWDVWDVMARMWWLRQRPFELIHAFESRPTVIFPARYGQKRHGSVLVLDWCDWFGKGGSVEERPNKWLRGVLRPLETHFETHYRTYADGTTVINSVLHRRAVELGVDEHTIFHLPNGGNLAELHLMPQEAAREELGLPTDALLIGYVGALFAQDARLMAQAFDRVYAQEPRARLVLVGYVNVPVEELVRERTAVLRTGPLSFSQISTYLSACDLCWLPLADSGANQGRFPLKLNDYMALGKPVVATAVGDIPQLIHKGQFGLVAPAEPDALAAQVVALLHNPQLRAEMGVRARLLTEEEFNWDDIAQRLERYYQQLLSVTSQEKAG
jgi:glycosyltransferase involved in cell wall biosynthesis